MKYIVETNNLTKKYKNSSVVGGVNLKIPEGEIYGFLGPNGAGKTTSIRMLLGLIKATEGNITIFGKDLNKNRLSILSDVGALVENPSYYAHLNAIENLEVYRILRNIPKEKVHAVLKTVGLQNAAHQKVKEYSLGMKQRLGLAIALLGDPRLLILDEPTNGLDPQGIHEMRELIKSLAKERGITILVSSHLLSEIDQMATYVGIISKGRLIFQDKIEILRQHSQNSIKLLVDKPKETLKIILASGIPSVMEKDKIVISNTNNTAIAKIVKTLVANDISVFRIEEEKNSLEDIFLNIVKEEQNDVQIPLSI
ncbi:ABC transporter ATP-binding protein [Bacillus pseudomycoides]|uniref:ABC transporter ATP-binding protein n=1 Tax=Bacillus pseudomycoides TaxID=64104 RepID=UPI000BEF912D|nr:ABC transporter ATP-binding protein [Bacillus pseudomycoides]PEI49358.1 bacitracin ABC transporter ATP-binding protein [Bacillus pseudomycoides]PGA66607.1 bacitracin ABC transporter ATP-binding protein [Bacillus pseudomycoides]PGF05697.1 bacitracin ABC transporter ATP-binding protein [Bacillus pseudomycoides]PHE07526.1 bacitracin ABC transporter ATP-binding protein [Bacillus pseudomycoides]PHE92851.1 bacitracin ABC transporter ATP-binding protein [Bacillus pseudomycoides]